MRKRIEKRIKVAIAPRLISSIVRFLYFTLKITEHNIENVIEIWNKGESAIIAFWHGRLLMVPMIYFHHKERQVSGLISYHSDGEILTRSSQILGYEPIRGSTGKGKGGVTATREMIRALKNSTDLVLTPDGPNGPRHKVQRGIVELARMSGSPIIPMAFSSSKRKILNTWDAFLLPLPFSKGVYFWGEPIYIEQKSNTDYLERKRKLLEERLIETTNMADNYFLK